MGLESSPKKARISNYFFIFMAIFLLPFQIMYETYQFMSYGSFQFYCIYSFYTTFSFPFELLMVYGILMFVLVLTLIGLGIFIGLSEALKTKDLLVTLNIVLVMIVLFSLYYSPNLIAYPPQIRTFLLPLIFYDFTSIYLLFFGSLLIVIGILVFLFIHAFIGPNFFGNNISKGDKFFFLLGYGTIAIPLICFIFSFLNSPLTTTILVICSLNIYLVNVENRLNEVQQDDILYRKETKNTNFFNKLSLILSGDTQARCKLRVNLIKMGGGVLSLAIIIASTVLAILMLGISAMFSGFFEFGVPPQYLFAWRVYFVLLYVYYGLLSCYLIIQLLNVKILMSEFKVLFYKSPALEVDLMLEARGLVNEENNT